MNLLQEEVKENAVLQKLQTKEAKNIIFGSFKPDRATKAHEYTYYIDGTQHTLESFLNTCVRILNRHVCVGYIFDNTDNRIVDGYMLERRRK